jgi:hypothetical protein
MPLINSPAELDKFRQEVLAKRDPEHALRFQYAPAPAALPRAPMKS